MTRKRQTVGSTTFGLDWYEVTAKSGKSGYAMEEVVRSYFLDLGYYVVRGAKFRIGVSDATDIDLFMYQRSGPFFRSRINVDIKYKGSPKAVERLFWAKGVQKVFGFNSCIVATTERRTDIRSFAEQHEIAMLDGTALSRLKAKYGQGRNRLSDEEFYAMICPSKDDRLGTEWKNSFEQMKSRVVTHLNFDGVNAWISDAARFAGIAATQPKRQEQAIRLCYLSLSLSMLGLDFLLKDVAFEERSEQIRLLSEGLRYGMGGRAQLDRVVEAATRLTEAAGVNTRSYVRQLNNQLEGLPVQIVADFATKSANSAGLFTLARELEAYAYGRNLVSPDSLTPAAKGAFGMVLDFTGQDRRFFFSAQSTKIEQPDASPKGDRPPEGDADIQIFR